VTGDQFSSYLKEHDFEVDPAHLYRAAAQVAIQGVLDTVPRLHRQTPQQQYTNSWSTGRIVSAIMPPKPSCCLSHCWRGSVKPKPFDPARAVTASSILLRTTFALFRKAVSSGRPTCPTACSLLRPCTWASNTKPMSMTLVMMGRTRLSTCRKRQLMISMLRSVRARVLRRTAPAGVKCAQWKPRLSCLGDLLRVRGPN
jgi:hypothetical protein